MRQWQIQEFPPPVLCSENKRTTIFGPKYTVDRAQHQWLPDCLGQPTLGGGKHGKYKITDSGPWASPSIWIISNLNNPLSFPALDIVTHYNIHDIWHWYSFQILVGSVPGFPAVKRYI